MQLTRADRDDYSHPMPRKTPTAVSLFTSGGLAILRFAPRALRFWCPTRFSRKDTPFFRIISPARLRSRAMFGK